MRRIPWLFAVGLTAVLAPVVAAEQAAELTALTVSPMGEPAPALRYSLLPPL